MSELLALPDDALLAVLAYLKPRELFGLRVVCRRLRDVCLHPELWRTAVVKADDKGLLRATFTLAPCLGELSAVSALPPLDILSLNTDCAVALLDLLVQQTKDLAQASAVVRKLSGLGGLKTVYLTVWATQLEALMPLLEAVYSVHGLQELFVTIDEECEGQVLAARSDVEVGPSLTALYYSAHTADPFLHRLLRSHAATLQRVALPCMKDAPMSLLANLANLRSLRCFFQDDLCALVGLPNLEKIDLTYKEIVEVGGMGTMEYGLIPVTDPQFPQKFPAGALSFLRRALRLRYVLLCLSLENPIAPLLALAESPSAQALERLVVIGTSDRMHQLPADFLSFFPALKRLQLDAAPPDALLRTIDSASVPRLMTLVVLWFPKDGCIHSWVHGPAIQDLLVRNPRLHLQVVNRSSDECSCRWCRWGCHPQLKGAVLFNLSSHSRMIQCPENCLQVTDWSCSSCARKEGN